MTTISIPESLSRCDDAVDIATKFLYEIDAGKPITANHLSWLKADVRSLQRYDIDFTDEETLFFDDCLAKLSALVQD